MAEEVGAGYVSLVPSMRGWSTKVKAELKKALKGVDAEVPVTLVFDKAKFAAAIKAQHGSIRVPVDLDTKSYRAQLAMLGKHRVTQKVHVETDSKGFLGGIFGGGGSSGLDNAARSAGGSVASSFTSGFASILGSATLGLAAAVALPMVAIPTAGLIASATLAGASLGAVFLGGFALRNDPELKKAVTGLVGKLDKGLTDAAKPLKGPFLEAIKIVGQGFKDIAPDVKDFFKTIAGSGAIQELARGLKGAIKSFIDTGALKKLGEAVGPALKQLGMALPDIANALSQFLISITKPETVKFFGVILRFLADFIRVAGGLIGWLVGKVMFFLNVMDWFLQRMDDIWTGVMLIFDAVRGKTEGLKQAFFAAARDIGEKWRSLWDNMSTKVTTAVSMVVATAKGIPARIVAALGNLGSLLFAAGRNVVQGLINGIRSMFGGLGNAASTMAGLIRMYLPFSPAKTGPLSGSGSPFRSGQAIAGNLAMGVQSQLQTVRGAADQLASTFAYGSSGGVAMAGAPAGGGAVVTIKGDGSRLSNLLIEVLKQAIGDQYGGSVDFALGG